MDHKTLLATLKEKHPEIKKRGVKSLILFGPWARNEAKPDSEIDFLLDLEAPLTFDHYREVKQYLSDLLKLQVELVMADPSNQEIWPLIEPDLIRIA